MSGEDASRDTKTRDGRDGFDLLREIGRGALIRGGDDMDAFLDGYAWGIVLGIGFLLLLTCLGLFLGS